MITAVAPYRSVPPTLDSRPIEDGWEVASSAAADAGAGIPVGLDWIPARVPGTVAGAHRDAGRPVPDDLDERDWWFRTRFDAGPVEAGERIALRIGGVATIAEVALDGAIIATSDSMFASHEVDLTGRVDGAHELTIRCLALAPRLAESRRPRARWRTGLVSDGNLRWIRTSLVGRTPGFSPGPPVVGPWREITLARRRGLALEDIRVRAQLDGGEGVMSLAARLRSLDGLPVGDVVAELDGPSGRHSTRLVLTASGDGETTFGGELRIPRIARWWPHTHGAPTLHNVRLTVGSGGSDGAPFVVDAGRVGFRTLAAGSGTDHDIERDGLDLHVNGTPVFARGAVWTPTDPIGIVASHDEVRASLELARDAGMNMLRIPGTGLYESAVFHDLCDELGLLVWQDLMFANLDYPFVDDGFRTQVEAETADVLAGLARRPSSAVVCGNSEVEQQVAMLGLDPELGRAAFYAETVPAIARGSGLGCHRTCRRRRSAASCPSVPTRASPTTTGSAATAARCPTPGRPACASRPNASRSANVPDDPPSSRSTSYPAWKAGVPRDRGAEWDFEDVRDHYLALLYGVDPAVLRAEDPSRYLALSQAVTGEVMAAVFGEWRRASSPAGGGLVLWWRDVVPGSGWGVIDRSGRPKAAYHHLRRALAPTALWMTDEGLGGVAIHVAHDRPEPLAARLRIALYRDSEVPVGVGEESLLVPANGTLERDVEGVLGHFVDASWSYRFGPPAQDLIVATLEAIDGDPTRPLAQAMHFPVGRSAAQASSDALGLTGAIVASADGATLEITTRRLAHGVRIDVPGFVPADDAFDVEPGHTRRIDLRPAIADVPLHGGRLTAANLSGSVEIELR